MGALALGFPSNSHASPAPSMETDAVAAPSRRDCGRRLGTAGDGAEEQTSCPPPGMDDSLADSPSKRLNRQHPN
jgi:hypothetical protein